MRSERLGIRPCRKFPPPIRRLTADDLELFSFSHHEGVPGDLVTFIGVGFNSGVSAVSFNERYRLMFRLRLPIVIAEVPLGATTGLITLTTRAVRRQHQSHSLSEVCESIPCPRRCYLAVLFNSQLR